MMVKQKFKINCISPTLVRVRLVAISKNPDVLMNKECRGKATVRHMAKQRGTMVEHHQVYNLHTCWSAKPTECISSARQLY